MALIVLSITSGKGLQHAIKDKFRALEGDFSIRAYAVNGTEEWRAIALGDSLYTALKNAPYVDQVFPVVQKAALLVNPQNDAFEGILIQGLEEKNFEYFKKKFEINSQLIEVRYGCWISETLAQSLQLGIGDTAKIPILKSNRGTPRLINSQICGTFSSGLDEFDRQNILMRAIDVRKMNGWQSDSVSTYVVHLNTPKQKYTQRELMQTNAAEATILDRDIPGIFEILIPVLTILGMILVSIALIVHLYNPEQLYEPWEYWNEAVPFNMQATSLENGHMQIFEWLDLFDVNIVLILCIVLVVAISNLITALLVLIIDRTRMIGILKAMGASDLIVLQVFQWLSLNILVKGLLIGNAIGLGLSAFQYWFKWIKLDPSTYYISSAPIYFDWTWIIGANLGFIVVAFLILLIPVHWISRLQPIKSIRFS